MRRGSELTTPEGSRGPSGASVARATLALGALLQAVTACRTAAEPVRRDQVVVSAAHTAPWAGEPVGSALAQWEELASAAGRPAELESATLALAAGDVDQALSVLGLAQEQHPASALYPLARGELQAALGFLRAAQADFEQAIELEPESPRAWSALGRTRLALGLYMRASRALERAIELGLDDAQHHLLLARAYRGCERSEEASREVQAALACVRSWEGGQLWIAIIGLSGARPGDVLPVSVFAHPLGLVGALLALSPDWRPPASAPGGLPLLGRGLPWR